MVQNSTKLMELPDKIHIIVRYTSHNSGHGDSCPPRELAMQGAYNSEPPHPAFLSLQAALDYLKTVPYNSDLRIYSLPFDKAYYA